MARRLTVAQRDVRAKRAWCLKCDGMTHQQIADILHCSVGTVANDLNSVAEKRLGDVVALRGLCKSGTDKMVSRVLDVLEKR